MVLGRSIKQFERLDRAIKETQTSTRNITTFQKLKQDLSAAETAFQQARARLAALRLEMQNIARPTRQMRANLALAHRSAHRLGQRLDQQRQALMQQRRAMQAAGQSTVGLAAQKKRLANTVGQLRRQYDRLGEALKRRDAVLQKRAALRSQLVDTVALGAAIAAPVRAAMQFESVMADVKKVVNFDSPEQFSRMQRDLLKLSTVIPMSAAGLGEIMAAAGQAGIARDELRQFTTDAAKMGVAFDMAGADAGSATTGLRSIFKLNQPEVIALGDAYNHLSNNMDATARDMLKIANRTGSTAELFGLTGQQVGALGATFLALKTPPEVAATGINALLLKLQTADKQGGRFQGALASMGMAAGDLKQAIAEDAQGALVRFLEAVRSSGDVTGNLADLFGAEYADDMVKLVGNLDLYRKSLGLIFSHHLKRWGIESQRPTLGQPVAERTASVIWKILRRVEVPVFLWNVFPLHPYCDGDLFYNRAHNARERNAGVELLTAIVGLLKPNRIIAIGNDAYKALSATIREEKLCKARHPSYGGQNEFLRTMEMLYADSLPKAQENLLSFT